MNRAALCFQRVARHALGPVLDLVLPTDCFGCGKALGALQSMGACLDCWGGLTRIRPPTCPVCGAPLPRGTDLLGPAGGRCADCVLRSVAFDGMRSVVEYDTLARRFILRAKFGKRPELFTTMGRQIGLLLTAAEIDLDVDAVIPVPTHPWTKLRRGFNPAAELARPVGRIMGLPVRHRWLRRRRGGPVSVKRLGAAARVKALEGMFVARRRLSGKRVLLVDDVYTTGATADSCARALGNAGTAFVFLAVWARTPRRGASG